jgi:hypothetical protein
MVLVLGIHFSIDLSFGFEKTTAGFDRRPFQTFADFSNEPFALLVNEPSSNKRDETLEIEYSDEWSSGIVEFNGSPVSDRETQESDPNFNERWQQTVEKIRGGAIAPIRQFCQLVNMQAWIKCEVWPDLPFCPEIYYRLVDHCVQSLR